MSVNLSTQDPACVRDQCKTMQRQSLPSFLLYKRWGIYDSGLTFVSWVIGQLVCMFVVACGPGSKIAPYTQVGYPLYTEVCGAPGGRDGQKTTIPGLLLSGVFSRHAARMDFRAGRLPDGSRDPSTFSEFGFFNSATAALLLSRRWRCSRCFVSRDLTSSGWYIVRRQ